MQYRPIVSIEKEDAHERAALLALIDNARSDGASYEDILEIRQVAQGRLAVSNYYRVYQTKDGLVAVACLNNRLRRTLRDAAGVDDPSIEGTEFRPGAVALSEHERVHRDMETAFAGRTTDEWVAILDDAGVPTAPFNLTEELYDDPHVIANDLIPTFEHPTLGAIRTPRAPITMSESSVGSAEPAPVLGAHTHDVLEDLGLGAAEIEELEASGIVVQWRPDDATGTGEQP
jgi:crotonobetainyl-CoA:carnitine CoA-transferase CaiB-like acyl-CoA transferase